MTIVLNVLLPVICVCLGFAQVASSSDAACLGACQAELASTNLPGSTGDTASEVTSYQQKLCGMYGKMKECFLTCDGGSEAWAEFSSDGSNEVLQFCGLTGGVGDSSSTDFQDMLCAQGCQLNASEIISNILPQGPPTGSDESESGTAANMEAFVEQNRQICAAEDNMKTCILGCKGGQKIWETQFAHFESSCIGSDGIRRNSCAYNCQQQRAEKINQMLPQNPDAQNPTDLDEFAKKSCPVFEEQKACILKCDGGEEVFKDLIQQASLLDYEKGGNIIEICGLGVGSENSSTGLATDADGPKLALSQDVTCISSCQAELATTNLPGSTGDTELSASEAANYQQKLCELYGKMKKCFLACDGGSVAWTEFSSDGGNQVLQMCGLTDGIGDSSSVDFQDMLCAQGCQLNASEKIAKAVPQGPPTGSEEPGSGADANIEVYLEQNRQICAAEEEMKTCILGCKGGQKIWETQFTTFVSSCSSGPDGIEAKTCAFACQQQQNDKLAQLIPQNRDATNPSDLDEAAKKACPVFEEIKSCVLKCDGGENAWNDIVKQSELMGAGDGGNIVQVCGLGDGSAGGVSSNRPSSVDAFGGASLPDLLCATSCQSSIEGKFTSALSGPDPETPDEVSRRTKQLCDVMNEFKDCLTTCGETGLKFWDQAFLNGSMGDSGIKSFARACFPGQIPDEVLENYQCSVGTCTKCSDMPFEQCMADFLTYPTLSACENSECGKIGEGVDNYNNCKMDGSTLGVSEINLQCNPSVPAAGCPPTYACLPFEAFGAHYCCPDTPEQAQILCMQKCNSLINSQQSKITSLIAQPDAFHEAACSLYQDEKDCILKCPSGQQGFDEYRQKQLSSDDSEFYQSLVETCGSTGETPSASTNAESVRSDAATSESSPEVAEYCRRVLNQKNGDTAFCKYQNFKETCKNVCPQ